ncbi:MAG: glycosyltransferase [Chitinophagaceae bacterium]|nr:MAG: glycosyltransferase [Chitinophagaceae bacterium]
MIIAVDTRLFSKDTIQPEQCFLLEVITSLARNHPEDQFIFLFDRPGNIGLHLPGNVIPVVKGPKINHLFMAKYWYDLRVPSILKKYKADIFLVLNGICSMTTAIPQCLVVHDLSFLDIRSHQNKAGSFFRRRFFPHSLEKAAQIITFSSLIRERIERLDKSTIGKTSVIYGSPPVHIEPLDEENKLVVRARYTGGKNYFLYAGPLDGQIHLIHILKAFSIFKKRQKSDWKLVLAGWHDGKGKSIAGQLHTYKHRTEVVLLEAGKSMLADLEGAAYAMIYPFGASGNGLQVLSAMKRGIPVIAAVVGGAGEVAGDAAIYIDPGDHSDIAEQMMRLYKDESLRNRLIEEGHSIANRYSLEEAGLLFWQSILRAIH